MIPEGRRQALAANADPYRHIGAATTGLLAKIMTAGRDLAIVGNSPVELGRGRGAEVDSHGLVFRFNKAPSRLEGCEDYECRTDVHVLPTRGDAATPAANDARLRSSRLPTRGSVTKNGDTLTGYVPVG